MAEMGHVEASASSQIVANYFASNTSAREVLRSLFPNTGSRHDLEISAAEDVSDLDPHDVSHEEVFDLQNDMRSHSSEDMLRQELFSPENESEFFSKPHYETVYFQDGLSSAGEVWAFWSDWYNGFLEGKPMDWKLQERVAVISDATWDAGPEAVAGEIGHIRARRQVEIALGDLKDSLRAQTTARHGIGGNNPPESIRDELLSGSITLIWEATEELSIALEEENPPPEWIEAILIKLKAGLADLLKWSALTVKLAVGTVVVIGSKKVTTAVVDAYIAKHPEKIEALIEALEQLLPFLR